MSANEEIQTLKVDATKVSETTETTTTNEVMSAKPAVKEAHKRKSSPTVLKADEQMVIVTLSDTEVDAHAKKPKKKKRSLDAANAARTDNAITDGRSLKRLKLPVKGAPKYPHTGYILYLNQRRNELRTGPPTVLPTDMVRTIAAEWQGMSLDQKEIYLQRARKEKERYTAELHTFLKQNPELVAIEKRYTGSKAAARKLLNDAAASKSVLKDKSNTRHSIDEEKRESSNSSATTTSGNNNKRQRRRSAYDADDTSDGVLVAAVPGEIPIYTNEFLDQNKHHDGVIRVLRKKKMDLDNKKAMLESHVQNIKNGVEKLKAENEELEEKNRLLEVYLEKLKQKLAQAFAGLPLPTAPNGATLENIDQYMLDLQQLATSNTHGPAYLSKAKDIVRKLDLHINF